MVTFFWGQVTNDKIIITLKERFLYPTEEWDIAWNGVLPGEMGSTRVGGMKEGLAPQAENKISS
jgi:protein tyrosine phosphatase